LQKELGLSIGPKDPLLAQWLSQKALLEENAAEHQRLLSEFEAALGRNQTTWSEQTKNLAQQRLNAGLRAARDSTALMLEEAARMNAAAVRKACERGCYPDGESACGKPPDRLVESDGRYRGLHRGDLRHLRACDPQNRLRC
jgi:Transcriptional activator TraM